MHVLTPQIRKTLLQNAPGYARFQRAELNQARWKRAYPGVFHCFSVSQKVIRALNCTVRAPRVEVKRPKSAALIEVENPVKFVWFRTLNMSQRSCRRQRSEN